MSGQQDSPAERLEALGSMVDELDGANPDPAQQQAEQQAQEAEAARVSESELAARQWGMLMFTIGGMACMVAPDLRPVYSEERCFMWGQQANAVAEKYGWNGPSRMPELALLASTAGFAVPTFFAVRAQIDAARDGKGPAGWLAKAGIWWRTRKARKAAATAATMTGEGGGDGGQQ